MPGVGIFSSTCEESDDKYSSFISEVLDLLGTAVENLDEKVIQLNQNRACGLQNHPIG